LTYQVITNDEAEDGIYKCRVGIWCTDSRLQHSPVDLTPVGSDGTLGVLTFDFQLVLFAAFDPLLEM
jgi:hypothetical protein